MPENNLYYIYIDSKIEGTIDQLMSYFQAKVFYPEDCICIYFKYYKEVEKHIKNKFNSTKIKYKFIRKNSDFFFERNKIVFYLFNAQSNCRVVANRHLTHIFVTHGESHKLASIKPILRIYDFVITSGKVGIERLLRAGIFNLSNVHNENRIIPMGNTFIGQHHYRYNETSEVLLYAPTWEGGVIEENYSSVSQQAENILNHLIEKNTINHLMIQLHPNLGHRDKSYLYHIKQLIKNLKKKNIKITIIKSTIQMGDRLRFSGCNLIAKSRMSTTMVKAAVVDISAMEIQCFSEYIPTLVLYRAVRLMDLIIPKRVKYLYGLDKSMDLYNFNYFDFNIRAAEMEPHRDYLISYQEPHLAELSFQARIHWLCHFVQEKKQEITQQSLDIF